MGRLRTSLALSVAALAAGVVPVLAAAPKLPHGHYSGRTSQGTDVQLYVSADGKRVTKLRIHYLVTCDDQRKVQTFTDIVGAKIKRGRFAGNGTYTGTSDQSHNVFAVKGVVRKRSATGNFTLTATGTGPTGGPITCQTGALTWRAQPKK